MARKRKTGAERPMRQGPVLEVMVPGGPAIPHPSDCTCNCCRVFWPSTIEEWLNRRIQEEEAERKAYEASKEPRR